MKRQPSHLNALVRLFTQALRGESGGFQLGGESPERRLAVERDGILVNRRRLTRFLEVTAGSDIFGDAPGAILSTAYRATWETVLALEMLVKARQPIPRGGVLHVGGEVVRVRPHRVGDRIRARMEVDAVEMTRRGLQLTLETRSWNGAGLLCTRGKVRLLFRDPEAGRPVQDDSKSRARAPVADPGWRELSRWSLGADHGRRYARVSRDYNPIHLSRLTARLLGVDGPILHGYCIEALVSHDILRKQLGSDPSSPSRIDIGFRAPVRLPSRPRLMIGEGAGESGIFRLVDEHDDRFVLAEGSYLP